MRLLMRHLVTNRAVLMALAFPLATALPTAAQAQDPYSELRNGAVDNKLCLQFADGNMAMVTCKASEQGQSWYFPSAGGNKVKISNVKAGLGQCLDVVNDAVDTKVRMAPCTNTTGQTWTMTFEDGLNGGYQFTNDFTGPGKCLDLTRAGFLNFNEPRLYPCEKAISSQNWKLEAR